MGPPKTGSTCWPHHLLPHPLPSELITPPTWPCPARRGPGEWGLGQVLGHSVLFDTIWLIGQECVMSPVVVTGLQECGHQR